MGDVVAWRVIDMPASGQISNVSKLVVRWPAGMPDDRRVHPSDMGAEPWSQPPLPDLDKLVEYARLQVERERLKLQRKALHSRAPAPRSNADAQRRYRPQDKALRIYRTCRAQFVEWEQAVKRLDLPVTQKTIFNAAAAPHPRTQDKIMALHGLFYPRDWPPHTWPDRSPSESPGQI